MSQQLLSSKVVVQEEEPQIRQIQGVGTNDTGFVGVTEKGPIGVATLCVSPEDYRRTFGSYVVNGEVAQAVDSFFQNGGARCWIVRTVHFTDPAVLSSKSSAAALLSLLTGTASPSPGAILGSLSEPFDFEPGYTIVGAVDGGGNATGTFNATAGTLECASAENYVLSNGMTLLIKVDGEATPQTVTFTTSMFASIGAATAEEVAAAINGVLRKGRALVTSSGTKVTIQSDKRGTGSSVQVTGGAANTPLGFVTTVTAGTGNVADIDAVTVAEVKAVAEAAISGLTVTNVAGAAKFTSNSTGGSSSVQIQAASTADTPLGVDNAVHTGGTGSALSTLTVAGKWDGTFANSLTLKVEDATSGEAARFNLSILKSGIILETWPNLSMDDLDARYIETILNDADNGSLFVMATDLDAGSSAAGQRPVNGTFGPLSGGSDGLGSLVDNDFIGAVGTTSSSRTGMRSLDVVGELALLAIPGRATAAVHVAMLTYCEVTRNGSILAILDPPANLSATGMVTYVEQTAGLLNLSEFGAIYWPRVKVLNPSKAVFGNTDQLIVAPSGGIAGICARNDAARDGGVYDAPAGIEQGVFLGCLGFETDEVLDENKRDIVVPKRINPITTMPGQPRFVDGHDTLKSTGNFPSVSERRGVIYIEQSIKAGLQFARHKNNDEALRARVSRTVNDFLITQMKNRAFRSLDPSKAFFQDFGAALNTDAQQFAGKLIGRVGLATQKPAKFIIVRFSQDTRAFAA